MKAMILAAGKGERLRPLLRLAVVCAAVGVAHEWWYSGAFSWVTLLAALGYPPYFMLRRWMRLDAFSGFILEMLVLVKQPSLKD